MSEPELPGSEVETEPSPPAAPAPGAPTSARAKLGLMLVAVVALVALFWPRTPAGSGTIAGGRMVDIDGASVPIEREMSRVTLVHFWATWCPPCITELPELRTYASELGAEATVLFVAVDDDPRNAARFFGDRERPLYFDPTWALARRFGTDKLPETHLVVDGKVVESFVGATAWSRPEVRERVQKWTARPASATP